MLNLREEVERCLVKQAKADRPANAMQVAFLGSIAPKHDRHLQRSWEAKARRDA